MKKSVLLFLTIFCLLGGLAWYMIYPQYYYVKITGSGIVDKKYEKQETYTYNLKGYDKTGNEKDLTFSTHPDLKRPFKRNAYLKIRYTNLKRENGYEEVKRSDIPKEALIRIECT
ncbi:YxeA family protein [Enterococcus faecalis]|uniref:YxeA family protein n=1 Tax=Enterococcus faecalis TaxID=1351 RepID=UPI0001E968D1|nr:YxeA family protein [Enterococcus faecalis]EFQ69766.1 hypothetical protein HMPREF9510_02522 [Enterococcus faecalis TX0470]EOK03770.1 hypothetical protein WOM_00587 [Enterococcus faecalis EnGen0360]